MIRVGTRGSALAQVQADRVIGLLQENGFEAEKVIVKTTGDKVTDRPLYQLSGFGAFVRELDDRMLAGDIDLAVHSMKDIPTQRPKGIVTSAILKRDNPFDALIGKPLSDLEDGDVVGTSSLRRRAQVLRLNPRLETRDLRGNVDTRLRKLREGEYDAIILAEAGLERMGYDVQRMTLDPEGFLPSANQGTIAVTAMEGSDAEAAVRGLDDPETRAETTAERAILAVLGAGCIAPIAAYAQTTEGGIRIRAEVLSLDGQRGVKVDEVVSTSDYNTMARELAIRLRDMGGKELIDDAAAKIRR